MKYGYAYKTSDGVRHEAQIEASSREEVFALLRAQGIRAIKVVASDGSKANGEVRGVRRRVLVASVLTAGVAAGALAFWLGQGRRPSPMPAAPAPTRIAAALPRQEIAGDRLRLAEAGDALFAHRAERFLARFAEPGVAVKVSPDEVPAPDEFLACLDTPIRYADDELTEAIDLKRMVVGMKNELSAYLKGGGGVPDYLRELFRRQSLEAERKAKAARHLNELLKDDDAAALKTAYDYYLKANAQLHAMGIAPLPMPYALLNYQSTIDEEIER